MGRHPRIETPDKCNFITIRTRNSELWFVNNKILHERFCAYLAKYQEKYKVIIYAFVIQGNHYHLLARFPKGNRALFMRDLNSMLARLTKIYVPSYPGGTLWGGRYSPEVVPEAIDIEDRFFYCALQAVNSGLAVKPSDYPSYNSWGDAVWGREKTYKVLNLEGYNAAQRKNPRARRQDFISTHTLKYSRLPGYGKMPKSEYVRTLHKELEVRRSAKVKERQANKLEFCSPETLRQTRPGARPRKTKTSTRTSHRPRVLTRSAEARAEFLKWYFSIIDAYRKASKRYREGKFNVEFPPGTYRPYVPVPIS